MRIVGGRHRGRPLKGPKGSAVRPTSDRARESLFNILVHGQEGFSLKGASVVDVFSGSGALGLEALSRGAAQATFIDNNSSAIAAVRANAAVLKEWRKATLLKLDATRLAPPPLAVRAPCALAFLDPPYESGLAEPAMQGLQTKGWLTADALCVVEVAAIEPFAPPRGVEVIDARSYGAARFVFLQLRL